MDTESWHADDGENGFDDPGLDETAGDFDDPGMDAGFPDDDLADDDGDDSPAAIGHDGDDEDLSVVDLGEDDSLSGADDDGDGDLVTVVDEPAAEQHGADPDAVAGADDSAFTPQFPPELHVDPMPEPVDGPPWSDAALLGDVADPGTDWSGAAAAGGADDLLNFAATDNGGWEALMTSDDPAVAGLARWWQP